jgi:hypothetical protein
MKPLYQGIVRIIGGAPLMRCVSSLHMMPSSIVSEWSGGLPRRLRLLGLCMFAVSFFVPARADELHLFGGIAAFFETPMIAVHLAGEGDASHVLLGIAALAAWSANFTIFSKRRFFATSGIVSSWVAYVCFFQILAGFIPFYPWAIGITLINLSRLSDRTANKPLHSTPR